MKIKEISINIEIYNYNDYSEILINKLNSEPLITYSNFIQWASELYREKEYRFIKFSFVLQ